MLLQTAESAGQHDSPKTTVTNPYDANSSHENLALVRKYIERKGDTQFDDLQPIALAQVKKMAARVKTDFSTRIRSKAARLRELRQQPITLDHERIDDDIYAGSPEFFESIYGPYLKISGCDWWGPGGGLYSSQEEAERNMMERYIERADLKDHQRILDVGSGYGYLSLHIAERFPHSEVVAMNLSRSQGEYLVQQARKRGLPNIKSLIGDIGTSDFESQTYDRIVCVEVLEHMLNYELLLTRFAKALNANGFLFIQFTTTKDQCFAPEEITAAFTGEQPHVPADFLPTCATGLKLEDQWWIDGTNYARTHAAMLTRLRGDRERILQLMDHMKSREEAEEECRRMEWYLVSFGEEFLHDHGDFFGTSQYLFGHAGV